MNRKSAPPLIPFKPVIPSDPKVVNIAPGVPMFLFPDDTTDVFYFSIHSKAGHNRTMHPYIPSLTGSMLAEGTANYNANDLADTIDFYGAFFQQEAGRDSASVYMYAPSRHAAPVIDLTYEIFSSPTFPKTKMKLQIEQRKQQYHIDRKKVKVLASETFFRNIFGESHPYGQSVQEKDFNGISRDDLVAFHNNYYTVKNSYFIIAGKFSDENIRMVKDIFGHKANLKKTAPFKEFRINELKKKNVYINVDNAVQSAIRIGFPTINKTHKDYPLFQLLTTILGGYFGSRLMRNIREEKGYTYGIGAGLISFLGTGYFSISSEVGSKVCNAAIDEIYKEIDILKKKKIKDDELQMVKNYLSGEFIRMFDGFPHTSQSWRAVHDFEMDFGYYQKYYRKMMEATPAQLLDIANRYFIRDKFHEIVAGKR